MASKALHLLVALVALSSLLSFISLPAAKARILLVHELPSSREGTYKISGAESERETTMEVVLHSRMDLEINRDYPGSGANNRHTPNPQVKD